MATVALRNMTVEPHLRMQEYDTRKQVHSIMTHSDANSGRQPREVARIRRRFGNLFRQHRGSNISGFFRHHIRSLRTGKETFTETSVSFNHLTLLVTRKILSSVAMKASRI